MVRGTLIAGLPCRSNIARRKRHARLGKHICLHAGDLHKKGGIVKLTFGELPIPRIFSAAQVTEVIASIKIGRILDATDATTQAEIVHSTRPKDDQVNVGIVLPNWIGDAVMATPTLRALRHHFGAHVRILGIMRPHIGELLRGTPWIDEGVAYDPRAADRRLHTWPVARQLRAAQVEVMVLLTNSLRSALLGFASGARMRVGYARSGRGWLLTQRLKAPRMGRHWLPISAVDYYLQLAYAMGCGGASRAVQLATLPEDELGADRVWQQCGIAPGAQVVILNGGAAYGSAKQWPIPYFAQLAQRIVQGSDSHVLAICGPQERAAVTRIVALANHRRVHSLADFEPSVGLSKACVRRSHLMVTNDSGPRHFAAAFGIPVVTLFGSTDPQWSETEHPRAVHLQHPIDCAPCGRRVCPLGHHRCMNDLTPDTVYATVGQMLAPHRTRRMAA